MEKQIFTSLQLNKPALKFFIQIFLLFTFSLNSNCQTLLNNSNDSSYSKKILLIDTAFKKPTTDEKVQIFFSNHHTKTLDNISKYALEPWGDGLYSLPALGGFYIYGSIKNDDISKDAAIKGLGTFIVCGLATGILKYSFHRQRPFESNPPNSRIWDGPSFKKQHLSFPSGHTSSIFSLATIISAQYKYKPSITAICFSIATLTAISRIYDNKHWLTDVLAGAIIGTACGQMMYQITK
jgi:membrane-associated phospholipid phosphatase